MTHRHYGVRGTKPPATDTGQAPAGAWSGSAFIWSIVVIMVVLGVIFYRVSKTVTDIANTTSSVPHTSGQGSMRPQALPGLRGRAESQAVGLSR
jgi:hypothetical protein